MFIPIPVLIAISVVFLVVLAFALRSSRGREPLMGGGQAPRYRPSPAAPKAAAVPVLPLPPEVEEQVRALLAAGRKIDAIKLARDVTHLGLKDTKDLVESME